MRKLAAVLLFMFGISSPTLGQSEADIQHALAQINWAWSDHGPCSQAAICFTYFDSWGVSINFSDGSIAPFAHVQRLTTSAHDCIQNAKNHLASGDRGLAVMWVMASQAHNPQLRGWMRDHPDALIAALRRH